MAALDDYMNLVRDEREARPAEAILVDEIDVLRTVVRRYCNHEYTRPWQTHSPADEAYERAMTSEGP